MAQKVAVLLADGFEEIEALAVVDVLRRAQIETVMVAVSSDSSNIALVGRNAITVVADCHIEDIGASDFQMIILPGGQPGTENLKKDERVRTIIEQFHKDDKKIAAICAAPTILSAYGLIEGKNITSHPSVKDELDETNYKEDRVVVDGNIITSRGPGTAIEFALTLVEILINKDTAQKINAALMGKS